jgi:hypothetical protein
MAPNSDQPAFPEADCFATSDESRILEWWGQWPDANIGIATDNLLALHVKTAPAALALGALLQRRPDTPRTVRIILDNDDREQENHVVFSLPKGANAQARTDIVPGVSVLDFDGVIIGPGSVLKGARCIFASDAPVTPAPLWLMEMCGVELPAESKTMNVVALKKPAPAVAPTKTKLDWALDAAARGLDVFPIRPYIHPGLGATPEQLEAAAKAAKAPLVANWQNLATQDKRQIREWWSQWPDANIATTTEKFIVVDIDPRNGGKDTFEMLRLVDDFSDTAISNTQGGGNHIFYASPQGVRVKGGTSKLGPGVDIKSAGGYVLLPGSTNTY